MKYLSAVLMFLCVVLSGCVSNVQPDVMTNDEIAYTQEGWPANVKTAVHEIVKGMDEESRNTVLNTAFDDLILFHHGWGTGIRNSFGLWHGNKSLMKSACGEGGGHPDDASMVIIEAVWNELQQKSIISKGN